MKRRRSIKSRSQANRKGWRTRKLMKAVRSIPVEHEVSNPEPGVWVNVFTKSPDPPSYMRRALPNPWLDFK